MKKIAYHPSGTVIEFRSDDHSYIDDDDNRYVSVTRVVGDFFKKFDAKKMARHCSKKETGKYAGLSPDEILAIWDTERDRGQTEGINVHEYAEAVMLEVPMYQRPKPISDRCQALFLGVDKAIGWLRNTIGIEPVGAEMIVFKPDWPFLAGMIDLIVCIPKAHRMIIIDWKQNKEITDCDLYGKTGKGPLKHLEDTDFSHYTMQLSIYRYIIETEGYFDLDQWALSASLIHILPDGFRPIKLPYLKNEVEAVRDAWQWRTN